MSSRKDAKKMKTFCKHMREAIIDEKKAVPDYTLLKKQGKFLTPVISRFTDMEWADVINGIIKDEKRHRGVLEYYFKQLCPRR